MLSQNPYRQIIMKKFLTLLLISFLFTTAYSQLYITEIMYNSPDPGQDSLEFIEIYNAGSDQSMAGYTMTGVTFEFSDLAVIPSEGFYYISNEPDIFFTTFGVTAEQFTGATSNAGEELSIIDPAGTAVFSVDYDDGAPWPTEDDGTDGLGASIVLCDFDNPTLGESWRASATSTGKFFDGIEILASISTIDDAACDGPSGIVVTTDGFAFVPKDITINVGETITFTNGGGLHNANGSQDIYPDNPVSFTSGAPSSETWEFPFTFNLPGFYEYQCDQHISQDMTGTVTVLPAADDSDIRLTEVFYNSAITPDSLEFIELYNAGASSFNVEGMTLVTSSINTVLTGTPIAAGSYGLIVKNESAFSAAFPGVAINAAWGDGTLSNQGDNITITNSTGTVVVNDDYDDDGAWPVEADGGGSSLIVCDPLAGFVLDNIKAAFYPEITYEDKTFYATPGVENYCSYDIGEVTIDNSEGINVSNGLNAILEGTVYGINVRPGGLQFTVIDEEGDGIGVFSGSEAFGYVVHEGDEVRLIGTIGQFNGLSQIYLDDIQKTADGAITNPTVTTLLGEETESQFVTIENVTMVNPTQWLADGSTFNFDVTDGTNVFTIRIDDDVEGIDGVNYPTGVFNVTGLGGQFDDLTPFNEGYQLFPRYITDIDPFEAFVDTYPPRTIPEVKTVDAEGVPDSINIKCTLQGRALGINLRTTGLQFTLVNEDNQGIAVFSSSETFGYIVEEGDLLSIKGVVGQFNGLTQIVPDSLFFEGSGSITLVDEVTVLDEETESSLIKISELLTLVDPSDWKGDGTSYSFVAMDDSGTEYEVFIDNDVDASTAVYDGQSFFLSGIGSQRDVSQPFTDGYRIAPRSINDFAFILSTDENDISNLVTLFPNPTSSVINIEYEGKIEKAIIYNMLGEKVGTFTNQTTIDVRGLTNGQYSLLMITKQGQARKAFTIFD